VRRRSELVLLLLLLLVLRLSLRVVVLSRLVRREVGANTAGRRAVTATAVRLSLLLKAGGGFVPTRSRKRGNNNGRWEGRKGKKGKDAPSEILQERRARLVSRNDTEDLKSGIVRHFLSVARGGTVHPDWHLSSVSSSSEKKDEEEEEKRNTHTGLFSGVLLNRICLNAANGTSRM
jgi:hypothetical protein